MLKFGLTKLWLSGHSLSLLGGTRAERLLRGRWWIGGRLSRAAKGGSGNHRLPGSIRLHLAAGDRREARMRPNTPLSSGHLNGQTVAAHQFDVFGETGKAKTQNIKNNEEILTLRLLGPITKRHYV